ncbi:MAG: acyltransferase [Candidatus Sulfotelmatobacter sp.]
MPSTPENTHDSAAEEKLLRPFMPELDMLRGIAVLAVLLLHGFYWRYGSSSFGPVSRKFMEATRFGWTGVNLFFVLSGFLITGILLDSKNKPQFYRRFYTRRALRILPAYYALLILLLVLRTSSAAFVGLSFLYLANMTQFFGVACDYGPLWSLAVEEHFYILWPAVVRKVTIRQLAAVSASITVLVPLLRAASFALGYRGGLDWYTWFVADGLAAGALLAIVLRTAITRKQVGKLCVFLMATSAALGIAGHPFGIDTRERLLGAGLQYSTINVFFAGILLLFLLAGTSPASRYVNNSMLRFLGYLSYGLYLDHLLAFRVYDWTCRRYFPQLVPLTGHFGLVFLRFALAAGGAVAAAYLSRRYFEERFLRLKDSLVPKAFEFEGKTGVAADPHATTEAA